MSYQLLQSILFVIFLTISGSAQLRQERARSAEQRALTLEPYFRESAKRYGVDVRILRTVCLMESRFRVNAVSPKGARGPMQFMPETARRYGLKKPHDPKASIDAAAHYLRDLLSEFGGRVDFALAAYNAGEGAVRSFRTGKPLVLSKGRVINPGGLVTGGVPPYRETQNYVKSALAYLSEFRIAKRSSSSLQVPSNNPNNVFQNRDFTLDVFINTEAIRLRAAQKASSSFIEIP